MSLVGVLTATAIVGGVGIFVGLFLGVAAIKFKVEVDEREEAVLGLLPGNNCGGCGFPGCSGLASAIVKGEAPVNSCPVGGASVGELIAEIMGMEAETTVRQVAFVRCQGDCNKTTVDYEYYGVEDCRMIAFVPGGGPKSCNYGCMGFGSCVKVCSFGAIQIVDGVAVVDREKCIACGKCMEVCPKDLITMIPYDAKYVVACRSKDKGPATMKTCQVGCIGCQLCKKSCPIGAVEVTDFLAVIDHEKCEECGICVEKCPKKSIVLHT